MQIIYRTALDHPHHCLYSILALSNASKDDKFSSSGHVSGKNSGRTSHLSRKEGSGRFVDEVCHHLPSPIILYFYLLSCPSYVHVCTVSTTAQYSTVGVILDVDGVYFLLILCHPLKTRSYSCIVAITCMLNESVSFPLRTK